MKNNVDRGERCGKFEWEVQRHLRSYMVKATHAVHTKHHGLLVCMNSIAFRDGRQDEFAPFTLEGGAVKATYKPSAHSRGE